VSEAADAWLESRRGRVRSRTLEADKRGIDYLKRYFNKHRVQDVSPSDIVSYLGALRVGKVGTSGKPLAEWSVVGALKTARAVFDASVLNGCRASNPTRLLQPHVKPKQQNRRQPMVLTAKQVDALVIAAAEKTPAYGAVVAAAAYSGARIREVLALRWCDIDHERKLIHLRGQINVDGTEIVAMKTDQSERFVALSPKLERFLGRNARMQARWSAADDYVFSASRLRPKQYRNVRRALATAAKEAGLDGVRAHDLRHSYVSNLLAHGDLATVSRAAGHANVLVTAKLYAHALGTPEEQAERAALAAAAAGLGY
jgi:integrase